MKKFWRNIPEKSWRIILDPHIPDQNPRQKSWRENFGDKPFAHGFRNNFIIIEYSIFNRLFCTASGILPHLLIVQELSR